MDDFSGDGYAPDSKVAKGLHKHAKTLPRWDKSEAMKALGWPPPIYLNGRRHRHLPQVRVFLANAAAATLDRKTA